jgi:hypothetical protein
MKSRINSLRILLALWLALAAVVVGTQALAQSNCVNGPPVDEAAMNADSTALDVFACAITSMPANCDNPGNQPHKIFWNHVLLASGDVEDELVVILPGEGQDPRNVEWLGKAAAYAGYRTIVLAYEGDALSTACGSSVGTAYNDCTQGFRTDVILGTPVAPAGVTDIHRANSAELRLLDLLAYLHTTYPVNGWDQYFGGATLQHDKIIISGYSLGSGHAAFWAKLARFAGVVTLSGPTDSSCSEFPHDRMLHPGLFYPLGCTNTLAAWIRTENPSTPGTVRYGAFHAQEATFDKLDAITRAWDNFGLPRLPGTHLVLDVTDGYNFATRQPWPLSKGEHRYSFNTPVPGACSGHQATAADGCLARNQPGSPGSGLPLVYPLYMNLYCAAGGDLP